MPLQQEEGEWAGLFGVREHQGNPCHQGKHQETLCNGAAWIRASLQAQVQETQCQENSKGLLHWSGTPLGPNPLSSLEPLFPPSFIPPLLHPCTLRRGSDLPQKPRLWIQCQWGGTGLPTSVPCSQVIEKHFTVLLWRLALMWWLLPKHEQSIRLGLNRVQVANTVELDLCELAMVLATCLKRGYTEISPK